MGESLTSEGWVERVRALLASGDSYAVAELLGRQPPLLAMDVYDKAQRELYWKCKDVTAVVVISRAGIQHGLTAALAAADEAEGRALRGAAKTMAYNLASFTWPGWGEAGVVLTREVVAIGLDAARVNLRLAEELDRPAKARAMAKWAVGAHLLAAGEHQLAGEAFLEGTSQAVKAGDAVMERMLDGYVLLANVLAKPGVAGAREAFELAVKGLKGAESEDAREYGGQLLTALGVFERDGK